VTYLHHDQQGSTRLLTNTSGEVVNKCSYAASYGSATCEGTATRPLGYDGQYTSTDIGLIYLRARVYDPATAQFMSVDPLAAWSQAPYDFAKDNPLNHYDPSGLLSLGEIVGGVEEGFNAAGSGLNEAGKAIASVGKYAAPAIDVLAGGTCVVVTEGACALVIAGNFLAQQALVADQAAYNPNYDWAANEAAIVAGTGLGLSGLGAVASSELGAFGKAALGAAVSSPAWILDLVQGLSPEAASATLLACR
jgi:RHS repeat-associated protein